MRFTPSVVLSFVLLTLSLGQVAQAYEPSEINVPSDIQQADSTEIQASDSQEALSKKKHPNPDPHHKRDKNDHRGHTPGDTGR